MINNEQTKDCKKSWLFSPPTMRLWRCLLFPPPLYYWWRCLNENFEWVDMAHELVIFTVPHLAIRSDFALRRRGDIYIYMQKNILYRLTKSLPRRVKTLQHARFFPQGYDHCSTHWSMSDHDWCTPKILVRKIEYKVPIRWVLSQTANDVTYWMWVA